MISRIVVEGFKSIRDEVDVEMAPLTILAGANSSGKSSLMQPLLLLKQSFEASSDPGPLLIAGANISFSEVNQMFWSAGRRATATQFRVGVHGLTDPTSGVEITFERNGHGGVPLEIAHCTWTIDGKQYDLRPDMGSDDLSDYIPQDLLGRIGKLPEEKVAATASVQRIGSFLRVAVHVSDLGTLSLFPHILDTAIGTTRAIIHVAALRGNPRRTYPATALGPSFPGLFHDYVASVIASWRTGNASKLERLNVDLRQLGLTWKAQTRKVSDAEVEVRVARLRSPKGAGSPDLVSIADAGFGVSQALPVVVALLAASPGQIVYLEQPEIHLHPRAQVAMANLLMRAAKRGVQVIAETHSELLLLGIQRLVAEGTLDSGEVKLHWFHRDDEGVTHVQTADLDEQGAFGDWPVDFAEVSMDAMRNYLEATLPTAQRKIEWPTA